MTAYRWRGDPRQALALEAREQTRAEAISAGMRSARELEQRTAATSLVGVLRRILAAHRTAVVDAERAARQTLAARVTCPSCGALHRADAAGCDVCPILAEIRATAS